MVYVKNYVKNYSKSTRGKNKDVYPENEIDKNTPSKVIEAVDLYTGKKNKWFIPSARELLSNSVKTWSSHYDKIERQVVRGGLPTPFTRVE